MRKNEVGPLTHTIHRKFNSEWIKGLNVRAETMKFSEENIGVNLCDPGLGNGFLDMTTKV